MFECRRIMSTVWSENLKNEFTSRPGPSVTYEAAGKREIGKKKTFTKAKKPNLPYNLAIG